MSLIRNILPSDGRLASKRPLAKMFKWSPTSVVLSAREGYFGLLGSASRATRIRKKNEFISDANDAISLIQVADHALDETTAALHKVRMLSAQALDDADTAHDRLDLLTEALGVTERIGEIFDHARFKNQPLLNGSVHNQAYSVGEGPDQVIPITIGNMGSVVAALMAEMSDAQEQELGSHQEAASAHIAILDRAIGSVAQARTTLGSLKNRFETAVDHLQHASKNTAEATSQVLDEMLVAETALFTRDVIFKQTEVSLLTQANQQSQVAMRLLEP